MFRISIFALVLWLPLESQQQLDLIVPRNFSDVFFKLSTHAFMYSTDVLVGNCFDIANFLLKSNLSHHDWKNLDEDLQKNSNENGQDKGNDLCKFHYDDANYVTLIDPSGTTASNFNTSISWYCHVENLYICDGNSDCLTDECNCAEEDQSDVFFCKGGGGCITFNRVCDKVRDCPDGLDELLCEGVLEMSCPHISDTILLTEYTFCDFMYLSLDFINCNISRGINCSQVFESRIQLNYSPLYKECLREVYFSHLETFRKDIKAVSNYCKQNCSHIDNFDDVWKNYCDNLYYGGFRTDRLDFVYYCELEPVLSDGHHITALCDEKIDCENGADELGCPGRFYCSPNSTTEWVSPGKICDNIMDCSNGKDECQKCNNGTISSSRFLIDSRPVLVLTGLAGVTMIILNAVVGSKCYRKTPTTHAGKIDRILCLQVFFFDGLMGLYNCSLALVSCVFASKGDYCLFDQAWRSSLYCSILGIIFFVASHGSLLAIAFISIIRCLICTRTILVAKTSVVMVVSGLLISFNIINSIIPVLPVEYLQEIFRTDVFYANIDNNPFINTNQLNRTRLNELHSRYFTTGGDLYSNIKNLNTITSNNKLFDITEIGYYGNTEMCIHNVFKTQDSYFIYKMVYCTFISILLLILTGSYVKILLEKIASSRRVEEAGGGNNNIVVDQAISTLGVKIFLMIGSQLCSWISFIGVTIYFQVTSVSPAPLTFEIFALLVIPVNSLLNPIFYSDLYRQFATVLWSWWRCLVTKTGLFTE